MPDSPIILIGPMAVGKTSVALELSRQLDCPNVPIDRIRWYYYLQQDYRIAREVQLDHDFLQLQAYWKNFDVETIRRALEDFSNCVMDFGAGHSYYPDPAQLSAVEQIMAPFPFIFLLLPSEEKEVSLRVCVQRLKQRYGDKFHEPDHEACRLHIWHESNHRLAKQTIYSDGKTVEAVAQEILQAVSPAALKAP